MPFLAIWFLLLVVRVLSRRPGAQFTPFEFVIVFLIGGVIIAATVGDDRSITNCVCAIITIGLMHRLTARLRAWSPRFGASLDGSPLVLLSRGQWRTEALHQMRIDDQDVMTAVRARGFRTLEDVESAVLERVGTISIFPREAAEGKRKKKEEQRSEKDESAPAGPAK